MPFVTPVFEAIAETTVFLDHFKELPDPRQTGKIVYRLDELLLLSLLALPCWSRKLYRHRTIWRVQAGAFCAGSYPMPTELRRMTGSEKSTLLLMWTCSRSALSVGLRQ